MILKALNDLYYNLQKKGLLPEDGFTPVDVKFILSLSSDGNVDDFIPTSSFSDAQQFILPVQSGRTSGVKPYFLADNSQYILGFPKDDSEKNIRGAIEKFEACKAYHNELLENVDEPWATGIKSFFNKWNPVLCYENNKIIEFKKELEKGAVIAFRVNEKYVHENETAKNIWRNIYKNSETGDATKKIICSVTSERDVLKSIHPPLKGVNGAQTSGAALVSYNCQSFESYRLKSGENAQVGEKAANAYTSALNYLFKNKETRKFIGDLTLLFWADSGETEYSDFASIAILGDNSDEHYSEDDLKEIANTISKGRPHTFSERLLNPDMPFYMLGLVGNQARYSVSFFYRNTFGEIIKNVNAHQERLKITGLKEKWLPPWLILKQTVRHNSKDKANTIITSNLFKSIFNNAPYPAALLHGVIIRIRCGDDITSNKAAIIKAYYIKNPNIYCKGDVLTMSLNEESVNVPYLLGRLFETYEEIQERAAGRELNTTIKDKYFNTASAAPSGVFPILSKLSQSHLRKMNKGLSVYFEKRIQDILSSIDSFPKTLNLHEQSAFILGYYHQKQNRYLKNNFDSEKETV